jgi:hypothetical protein
MILKSPTHGFRVSTLCDLLPDARYILIVRDPMTSFESVVRMWRKMFELYAFGPIPQDDQIREALLADRPRFEAKLAATTPALSGNRFVTITYESLVSDPVAVIEYLYNRLELPEFGTARDAITAELSRRSGYQAKSQLPSDAWQERIRQEWASILSQYKDLQS